MEQRFRVIGPQLNPDEKREIGDAIMRLREDRRSLPIEGELSKESEDIMNVRIVDALLKLEREYLRLSMSLHVEPEQLKVFKKDKGDGGGNHEIFGEYICLDDELYQYRNPSEKEMSIHHFGTVLHEALHSNSHQKLYVGKDEIGFSRLGYGVRNIENGHSHFDAFNEGMTQLIVLAMMQEYSKMLAEVKDVSREEVLAYNPPIYTYPRAVIQCILSKIASNDQEGRSAFEKLERGYFTGEMMHLRIIEKIYGKASLRVLDAMIASPKNDNEIYTNNKILAYFESDSPETRKFLQEQIVSVEGDETELEQIIHMGNENAA